MSQYNTSGRVNLTVTDGSTYTGAIAPDGSDYIVLNDGLSYTGLYHKSGALNAVATTNLSQYYAPNGSMYVFNVPGVGYTTIDSANLGILSDPNTTDAPTGFTWIVDSDGVFLTDIYGVYFIEA